MSWVRRARHPEVMGLRFIRKHLTTVVVAMITAMVTAGAPAMAHGVHALFAHNADKVDGKHAVGSGATLISAQGKLVAHDGGGRLPAKFIPKVGDSDKLDGRDSTEFLGDTITVVTSASVNNGTFGATSVDCPAGYTAVGGGVDPNNVFTMQVTSSNPLIQGTRTLLTADGQGGAATGWWGAVLNNSGATATFKVAVICSQS